MTTQTMSLAATAGKSVAEPAMTLSPMATFAVAHRAIAMNTLRLESLGQRTARPIMQMEAKPSKAVAPVSRSL